MLQIWHTPNIMWFAFFLCSWIEIWKVAWLAIEVKLNSRCIRPSEQDVRPLFIGSWCCGLCHPFPLMKLVNSTSHKSCSSKMFLLGWLPVHFDLEMKQQKMKQMSEGLMGVSFSALRILLVDVWLCTSVVFAGYKLHLSGQGHPLQVETVLSGLWIFCSCSKIPFLLITLLRRVWGGVVFQKRSNLDQAQPRDDGCSLSRKVATQMEDNMEDWQNENVLFSPATDVYNFWGELPVLSYTCPWGQTLIHRIIPSWKG